MEKLISKGVELSPLENSNPHNSSWASASTTSHIFVGAHAARLRVFTDR